MVCKRTMHKSLELCEFLPNVNGRVIEQERENGLRGARIVHHLLGKKQVRVGFLRSERLAVAGESRDPNEQEKATKRRLDASKLVIGKRDEFLNLHWHVRRCVSSFSSLRCAPSFTPRFSTILRHA